MLRLVGPRGEPAHQQVVLGRFDARLGRPVADAAAVPRARGDGGAPRGRRSRPGSGFGDTEAALRAKTSHSARDEHDRSSCERQLCTSTGPASEPTYNYLESMRAVHIKHQRREMGIC